MDLIDEILPALQEKERQEGYDSLSFKERVVLDVNAVEAEVNNGGFDQYFFNSAGDRAAASAAALRTIGANNAAAILEEACALFPDGKPSSDRNLRQDQLEGLEADALDQLDVKFYAYPDPIGTLLISFWASSPTAN